MIKPIYLVSSLAIFLAVTSCLVGLASRKAIALSSSEFNAARITDDGVFFNSNTMNSGDIQNFLNAKVPTCDTNGTQPSGHAGYATRADWGRANGASPPYSCLRDFSQSFSSTVADSRCGAITGGTKSAADIIFDVAQACGINPQTFITLLQKEQALVTDDWPWPIQYRSATGYGCPDTAVCDSQYYGFFNQVYNAGHQFKRYIQDPQSFNYAVGQTSFISYQANAPSCGGTNVTIQSQATAALYNYTPYQPNAAALANLYGTGDACSAYGNRNYWRMFNDWFGPTLTDGYVLAVNQSDNTQWVIFRNIRQYVPSGAIISAWGLPSTPVAMPANYLATIPAGPTLGRLFHLIGSPDLYFADGGKKYHVANQQMIDAWGGFPGEINTYVSQGLFSLPQGAGELTYSVKTASSPSLYMIDGINGSGQNVLRQYANPDVYHAWEGDNASFTTISDSYFAQISNAIGSNLTNTKIAYNGSEYQVIAGQRMLESAAVAPLYPGVALNGANAISAATFNRLTQTTAATYLMRAAASPNVYLVDNGTKHHILSPSLLSAWDAPGYTVNIVNTGYTDLIPDGTDISTYTVDTAGQLYLINQNKTVVPTSVDSAYRNIGTFFNSTSTLTNLFSTSGIQATGFIKGVAAPQIYLLDSSGHRRLYSSPDQVNLWGGYQSGITLLPDSAISDIGTTASPGEFVSDGTNEYVMENGNKVQVSSGRKANYGLSNAQVYSDGTLNRFSSGGSLDNKVWDGSTYYLIRGGAAYATVDINIANTWGIDTAALRSSKLIPSLVPVNMLTRFVKSSVPGDNRTFVIDGGNWYNLSATQRANLGNANEPTMTLDPSNAPNSVTDWTSVVVQDGNGKHYVIDGGTKRSFANVPIIQNQWTGNNTLTVPTTTNGFLNLLPNNGTIERAIKGSLPAVYSADTGNKRWILSPATYSQSYAPFASVSDALINTLPSGSSIP